MLTGIYSDKRRGGASTYWVAIAARQAWIEGCSDDECRQIDIEQELAELHAPDAAVHPYALLADDGSPILQRHSNGMEYAATYRTRQGATRGSRRWGGQIVERRPL